MKLKLKTYSFSYIEGGYSNIQAYDIINARVEADKYKVRNNITKSINYGSIREGSFI